MAIKKVYLGPFGPFEFDDSETVDDPDGDFSGETKCGLLTNGLIKVITTSLPAPTVRHFTLNSSGTHDVNDIGFVPRFIIMLCMDSTNTNINWSVGLDNGTVRGNIVVYNMGLNSGHSTLCSGQITRDVSNNISTILSARLSNGLRFTTTLVGTCSMEVIIACFP